MIDTFKLNELPLTVLGVLFNYLLEKIFDFILNISPKKIVQPEVIHYRGGDTYYGCNINILSNN